MTTLATKPPEVRAVGAARPDHSLPEPDVPIPADPRGPRPGGPPAEPPTPPLDPYDPSEPGTPRPGTRLARIRTALVSAGSPTLAGPLRP